MESLLLVNPRKRRKSRRRTPARGPGGRFLKRAAAAPRKRRRTRTATRRRRRSNPIVAASPVRRYRRRRSAARVHSRRRRRNPIGGKLGGLLAPIMPAVVGAGGAIVNEAAFNLIPLPASVKTGNVAILTRAALALGLGMVLGKVVGGRIASQLTAGALTVVAYQSIRPMVAGVVPGLGYYSPGTVLNGIGEYISDVPSSLQNVPFSMQDAGSFARTGMGQYINGPDDSDF